MREHEAQKAPQALRSLQPPPAPLSRPAGAGKGTGPRVCSGRSPCVPGVAGDAGPPSCLLPGLAAPRTLTEGGSHEGEAGEEPEEGHVAPSGNVRSLGRGLLLCAPGPLSPRALPSQRSRRATAPFSGDLGDKWGPSPSGSQAGSQPGTGQPLGKGQLPARRQPQTGRHRPPRAPWARPASHCGPES